MEKMFIKKNPKYELMNIRKAYITPNTIYFDEKKEIGNRLIRKYKEYSDKFLRINITNDSFEKLFFCGGQNKKLLNQMIYPLVINGINIVDKKFNFLSYSNSQFKNHSL
jgi:RNA-dependent RNA polymerase